MPVSPVPGKRERLRVKGVIRQEQRGALLIAQAAFHEVQVMVLIAAVELVAHDGMAEVREVDANLVLASGERVNGEKRELALVATEGLQNLELGAGKCAVIADAVLDRHRALFVPAQRRFDVTCLRRHRTVDYGEILFANGAAFPKPTQFERGVRKLGHHHQSTGFAIQTVDEVRLHIRSKIETHPTDEARVFIALGGMADQVGRLVNDQQFGVFVNYFEKIFHMRMAVS